MGYYGDFYRRPYGDYYRGDPGFLSFLGKGLSAVGGFIPGVGPAIAAAGGAISKLGEKKALPAAAGIASTAIETAKSGALRAGTALKAHPVLTAAGAAGLGGIASGVAGVATGKILGRRAALAGMGGGPAHARHKSESPSPRHQAHSGLCQAGDAHDSPSAPKTQSSVRWLQEAQKIALRSP